MNFAPIHSVRASVITWARVVRVAALLLAIGGVRTTGAGEILVSNLDQPPVTDPAALVYVNSTNYMAQQFTTAKADLILTSIVVSLGEFDPGSPDSNFTLVASLIADVNDRPDGVIVTSFTYDVATIPTTGNGYADVVLTPFSSVTLSANSAYWLVLGAVSSDGSGLVYWQYTESTDHTGVGSLPFGAFLYTDPPLEGWQVFSGSPSLMRVNVIPEPSSIALASVAIGCVLGIFPWNKRRSSRV